MKRAIDKRLNFFQGLSKGVVSASLYWERATLHWKLSQAVEACQLLRLAIEQDPGSVVYKETLCDWLLSSGSFNRVATATKQFAERHSDSIKLSYSYANSLLASGKQGAAEVEAMRGIRLALQNGSQAGRIAPVLAYLWMIACLRQGKAIQSPELDLLLEKNSEDLSFTAVRYWKQKLNARSGYAILAPVTRSSLQLHEGALGSFHSISIEVNGVKISRVLIDTGAAFTVFSKDAARKANLDFQDFSRTNRLGFSGIELHAGYVKQMKIGDFTIANVPVYVGDHFALGISGLQGIIGIDMMHRLQFTIDYSNLSVGVALAGSEFPRVTEGSAPWDIPIKTFWHSAVAQGHLVSGQYARILIDTGNYSEAFVSDSWAKSHIDGYSSPSLFDIFDPKPIFVKGLTIAGVAFPDWPVRPMIMERYPLDILLGVQLLQQYRTTIDLKRGVLRLDAAGRK